MTGNEVRRKYIEFFKKPPRNHKEIKPSPLILKDDPSTLFTSAGMQQLVLYLSGKKDHPGGKRLVNSQPSFRSVDIEEVGDNRHTTFFEMLGNWSFGDYFKKEQIPWLWEFLTKELAIPKEKLYISVFKGAEGVPKDSESVEIWKSLGIPEKKIFYYGVGENWWSSSGTPKKMPVGEIGGPDTEVFYEFESVEHDSEYGKTCHPNCECGRFLEIANSVFIQYRKNDKGGLDELPQKNVDFGAGLERLVAAKNDVADVFKIDLLWPIIEKLGGEGIYESKAEEVRVITDHMRAAVLLVSEGLEPSNKLQGYVLRRLIRRSVYKMRKAGTVVDKIIPKVTQAVLDIYSGSGLINKRSYEINSIIRKEADKFLSTLDRGVVYLGKQQTITPEVAFNALTTYGVPFDEIKEQAALKGQKIDKKDLDKEIFRHKELSRKGADKKFRRDRQET